MTSELYEVLRGALLGDGTLTGLKTGNAYFTYTSRSLQHVQFVANYFDEYKCGKGIYISDIYDKRTNKTYHRNMFVTRRFVEFTEERNKWYINGVKRIPNDLILTPLMCLIWYIGDGALNTNKNNDCQQITLATNCFKKEELEAIILPQLSQFDARLSKNGRSKKTGEIHYQIKIYKKENVIAFLKYIGECPFEDYQYKWDVRPSHLKNYSQYADEMVELYRLNFASTKIGLLYGCWSGTVRTILKNNNVIINDARNQGLFPPCEEWEFLYIQGNTIDDIATKYNCSSTIIKRYFDYIEIHGNKEFYYKRHTRKILCQDNKLIS